MITEATIKKLIDFHAEKMALMWEYLNDTGFPSYLRNAFELAEVLLGEDWVFIAPKHVSIGYLAGKELFGRRIGIALPLWDAYRGKLIDAAE